MSLEEEREFEGELLDKSIFYSEQARLYLRLSNSLSRDRRLTPEELDQVYEAIDWAVERGLME